MAERLKRAAAWLGLVTDDRYDDREDTGEVTEGISRDELLAEEQSQPERTESRRPEPVRSTPGSVTPLEPRRPTSNPQATSPVTTSTPRTADVSLIITVHPRTYNEARTIGEHFRDGTPVIMNLTEMEDVDAKRLVDFAAGLIFGLRGTIERVTSKVFLLSPHNVVVAAEDKERIAGGFFNQS